MVKFILMGYGQYASGFLSSFEFIEGKCKNIIVIDFKSSDLFDDIYNEISNLLRKSKDKFIILTDSPSELSFKVAQMLRMKYGNVRCLTGVNLPVLIDLYEESKNEDDLDVLVDSALAFGRTSLMEIHF